jgi:maltooligosyltrehalose trehalohydrolase
LISPLRPSELGANFQRTRVCAFRIWAPFIPRVTLRLLKDGRRIALDPEPRGYHSALVEGIEAGDRYLFDIGNNRERPDPASRSQPDGVHGPSAVVDSRLVWSDAAWRCAELAEWVIYELHVGTFTDPGTFEAAIVQLDRLRDLGVTAVELMPVAQFSGGRNWGYDGVYPFAVQASYGGAAELQRFVDRCHARGLAVVLDVVYNHFGPEGNYFRDFGPYFTDQYRTPWGEALNFDGPGSDHVRSFFIANALMWQTDFHIDALRLDAVHAIKDTSAYPFLAELADSCRKRASELRRPFYLIAESDQNDARLVRPAELGGYGLDAVWSDDYHHAVHSLLTGEREGYYQDFGELEHLARAYRNGFTYSGQHSPYRDRRHGNSPDDLEPWRFVVCCQNHDQVGNRARGERLGSLCDWESVKLAAGLVLLSPHVPLLFMGEEYGECAPFLYFVSHQDPGLIEAVRQGRRNEFAHFTWKGEVADPQDKATFLQSKLNPAVAAQGRGQVLHRLYRTLIDLRTTVPALRCPGSPATNITVKEHDRLLDIFRAESGLSVRILFHFGDVGFEYQTTWTDGRWRKICDSAERCWDGPGATLPEEVASDATGALDVPPRSFAVYSRLS